MVEGNGAGRGLVELGRAERTHFESHTASLITKSCMFACCSFRFSSVVCNPYLRKQLETHPPVLEQKRSVEVQYSLLV